MGERTGLAGGEELGETGIGESEGARVGLLLAWEGCLTDCHASLAIAHVS